MAAGFNGQLKRGFHLPGVKISPVADAFGAPRHYNPRVGHWTTGTSTHQVAPPAARQPVTPGSATSQVTSPPKFTILNHLQRVVIGISLMLVAASSWVAVTQFAKSTYQYSTFVAPLFVVYFSTAWMLLFYPVYLLGQLVCAKQKVSLKETFRENLKVYSDEALTYRPLKVIGKVTGFSFLWVFTSYVLMRAADMKQCLDIVALFATNSSFIYILSWILLQKQFMGIRIVATLLAMAGICIVTYMDGGFSGKSMWGAILVVTATASAAAFKVLFKKVTGDPTSGQVSIFLSSISLFSLVVLLPLFLLLYFTRAEPIEWGSVPWWSVCGTASTALIVNIVLSYGPAVTYPVFLQFSFVFAIPICAAVDLLWRHEHFSGMQISAFVLISLSAFLNLLPQDWHSSLLRIVNLKTQKRRDQTEAVMSPRQRLRSTAC